MLLTRFKKMFNTDRSALQIQPPFPLVHGLMLAGNPTHAMECINSLAPVGNSGAGPQILIAPESISCLDMLSDIPDLPKRSQVGCAQHITVSQVAMAAQRSITAIIDDPLLQEDEVNHLTIIQAVLAYASDARGGDQMTDHHEFLAQMGELSNPESLLQRVINPLTVMPELGSAIRLLQAYPGFSFGLIDHIRHEPGKPLHAGLKGRQIKMLKDLYLAHAGMIKRLENLMDEVLQTLPDMDAGSLAPGSRYKVLFDPGQSTQFLMHLFGATQAALQWKSQQEQVDDAKTIKNTHTFQPAPLDLIILLDAEHIYQPGITQDLYALAHHLWNTRSRTNNGIRLFVNWPVPWEVREQGKPMPLHGRILQGANAYYGPETDVIPAFRDVYGDRSPAQMNTLQGADQNKIQESIKQNDQKYAPRANQFGWVIDRQLILRNK
ncbi:MAG: hypothetical protein IBX50_12110 [Marinospirillum sp.]|uniref:hypothetical protein n=1 Tax=Marinospirillum sp. TaxID=2183934 RepID=UPI0019ED53C4|nr:hypothetical protein [Marinospirillum sp.]MBE0507440.1 hypothetical protein [Marinospirillum sp.]